MRLLLAAFLLLLSAGPANAAMPHGLYLGAAWYPEQ